MFRCSVCDNPIDYDMVCNECSTNDQLVCVDCCRCDNEKSDEQEYEEDKD